MKGISLFSLMIFIWMTVAIGCQFSAREPSYTREQFVSDSTFIANYMMDTLPPGSKYVDLGLVLIKCDAFSHGRLVKHSYKSTGEVMPPVHQLLFHFTHDGILQRTMSKDQFLYELGTSGSPVYSEIPYE